MANQRAARSQCVGIGRRRFLRLAFFGAFGTAAVGSGTGLIALLYPRSPERFSSLITIGRPRVPAAGSPPVVSEDGEFWLVHLGPDQGRDKHDNAPSPGGLLALSWLCPHEQCRIKWDPAFAAHFDARLPDAGFDCPCCGASFTRAGVRYFGPAPHSMDSFPVTVQPDASVVVDTSRRALGGIDNPRRAVRYSA